MWRLLDDMDLRRKKQIDLIAGGGRARPDPERTTVRERRLAFQGLTILLAVVVAWLAFRPSTGADQGLPWDKANHALAFMVLTVVSARGWPGAGFWRLGLVMLMAGAGIEIVQGLPLIGRDMDGWDVAADMVGFALGWMATLALRSPGDPRDVME
jgi:hypothetical protein